MENFTALLGWC